MTSCHILRRRDQRGFILAEIPIVVLTAIAILGVLTAIAVPSYFSQRGKAYDAAAKATAHAGAQAMEAWAAEHNTGYEGATEATVSQTEATMAATGSSPDRAPGMLITSSRTGYRLSVLSVSGSTFSVEREDGGAMSFECSVKGEGGCPKSGTWD